MENLEIAKNTENKSFKEMLDDFQNECDDVLEKYIQEGYLATFAGILSYMSQQRAQKILLSLDQDKRQKIEYIMNHNLCCSEFEAESVFASMKFIPLQEMTKIEKQREKETDTDDIMEEFTKSNPIFGKYLKKMHFNFNEILFLSDRDVQKILRKVDSSDLAQSLKDAPQEIKDKIFKNLSKRAANMLEEDIEFLDSVRKNQIHEARSRICSVILRLEESGEIVRNFPDENDILLDDLFAVWNE